jgi:hypothetical protein
VLRQRQNLAVVDWDNWRENYDKMTDQEQKDFHDRCFQYFPNQRSYSFDSIVKFLCDADAFSVFEMGGWTGDLAKAVLEVNDKIQVWSNFDIFPREYPKLQTCKAEAEREMLAEEFGYNLDKYEGVDKRLLLRNCVVPEMGEYLLKMAIRRRENDMTVVQVSKGQGVLF